MRIRSLLPVCSILLGLSSALPLAAQAWDVRLEVPFPQGQSLPGTLMAGGLKLASGELDTGKGAILSVSHRIIRVGPVLKLEGGLEVARWTADGTLKETGQASKASNLKQMGFGAGVNAQFWVPFTGLAGELGLIQRLQNYKFEGAGAVNDENLSRTWMRVATRYRMPMGEASLYVTASYQQPLSKDRPLKVDGIADLATYLAAQGKGAEFQRMWTFGVGLQF